MRIGNRQTTGVMAFDPHRLLNWEFSDQHVEINARTSILYALGVGLGINPTDPRELNYVYERDLRVLPTLATALGSPGFWISNPESGVAWQKVVHAEHRLTVHRSLRPGDHLVARSRVTEVADRGKQKGAVIRVQRDLVRQDGGLQSTQVLTMLARGNGGFGGPPPARSLVQFPTHRDPDEIVDRAVSTQAALIYRLSGDFNPLHADPEIARAAGFSRPILHGLCTYAVAAWSLALGLANSEARRIRHLSARFTAPVFPGETIRTEMWRTNADEACFRSIALERKAVVLDAGQAAFSDGIET